MGNNSKSIFVLIFITILLFTSFLCSQNAQVVEPEISDSDKISDLELVIENNNSTLLSEINAIKEIQQFNLIYLIAIGVMILVVLFISWYILNKIKILEKPQNLQQPNNIVTPYEPLGEKDFEKIELMLIDLKETIGNRQGKKAKIIHQSTKKSRAKMHVPAENIQKVIRVKPNPSDGTVTISRGETDFYIISINNRYFLKVDDKILMSEPDAETEGILGNFFILKHSEPPLNNYKMIKAAEVMWDPISQLGKVISKGEIIR